ncbi:hypothetical protein DPMN_140869 [Dreissena polymorpha]|uniref:Uncharacterized protein n=1 Tax=Dreissena polymorpha TaxID=45954 RepID=A0A9D4JM40_DREPO|nr:hypothetical protein DPMN_140869 [Dreissena polymorpha]
MPPGSHVFSPIWTIFELVRDINEINVLSKLHDDWAEIVTSRVFTRKYAPPPGGHVFQRNRNHFLTQLTYHLDKHFEKCLQVLTKVHEDQTIYVASRVFTRQNVNDGQKAITKAHHEHVVLSVRGDSGQDGRRDGRRR